MHRVSSAEFATWRVNVPFAGVPKLTHSFCGTVTGKALPVAAYVTKSCVSQLAVAVLALFITTPTLVLVPDASPLQFAKTFWIPFPPEIGALWTLAVALDPLSYHPEPPAAP